jgi:hypothetical protein
MSTHEDRHIDFVLSVIQKLARKYRILKREDSCFYPSEELETVSDAVC